MSCICRGKLDYGGIADQNYTLLSLSSVVSPDDQFIDVACAAYQACAIRMNRTIVCWSEKEEQ